MFRLLSLTAACLRRGEDVLLTLGGAVVYTHHTHTLIHKTKNKNILLMCLASQPENP